jgi:hypothetical protein
MISLAPHWVVGENRFYNQIEAWAEIIKSKQTYRFYFYENEYDRHDWTKEPTDSWDTLVHARCLQLRQQYKALKLFYSAGRDSNHILRSFVKHKIPIDELILMDFSENPIRVKEYNEFVLPMALKYQKINPAVKISTIKVSHQLYENFYSDDWMEKQNTLQLGIFQPINYEWMVRKCTDPAVSSTGFILGTDKPKIQYKDGMVYTAVLDKTLEVFLNNGVDNLEYFYYSPTLPELHIKQCHMLVNYLEEHYPDADQKFISEFVDNAHSPYYDEMCIAVGRGAADDVTNACQNGKNKYRGGHPLFAYISNRAKEEKWASYHHFKEAMNWFHSKYSAAFHSDNPIESGTIGIWGKQYFIKKFTPKHNTIKNIATIIT